MPLFPINPPYSLPEYRLYKEKKKKKVKYTSTKQINEYQYIYGQCYKTNFDLFKNNNA